MWIDQNIDPHTMCSLWIKLITSHHALFAIISISTSNDCYCYCVHFTTVPDKIPLDRTESNQNATHTSQAIAQCASRSYNAKTITSNLVAIHLLHAFALILLSFHWIHLRTTTLSPFAFSLCVSLLLSYHPVLMTMMMMNKLLFVMLSVFFI